MDTTTEGSIGGHQAAVRVWFNAPTDALVADLRADVRPGSTGYVLVRGPRNVSCSSHFAASTTTGVAWYATGDDRALGQIERLPFLDFGNGSEELQLKGPKGRYTFTLYLDRSSGSVSRSVTNPTGQGQSPTVTGGYDDPPACRPFPGG